MSDLRFYGRITKPEQYLIDTDQETGAVVVKHPNGEEIMIVDKDLTLMLAMDMIKASLSDVQNGTGKDIKIVTIFDTGISSGLQKVS